MAETLEQKASEDSVMEKAKSYLPRMKEIFFEKTKIRLPNPRVDRNDATIEFSWQRSAKYELLLTVPENGAPHYHGIYNRDKEIEGELN